MSDTPSTRAILAALPQQPQRQDSLHDQLRDLIILANRAGMYDAADYLTHVTSETEHRLRR